MQTRFVIVKIYANNICDCKISVNLNCDCKIYANKICDCKIFINLNRVQALTEKISCSCIVAIDGGDSVDLENTFWLKKTIFYQIYLFDQNWGSK